MKFSVLWTSSAERELATLWLNASERAEIAASADTIDRLLHHDGHLRGESRYENVRIMLELPLGVYFEVSEEDRTVYVLSVWAIPGGKSET